MVSWKRADPESPVSILRYSRGKYWNRQLCGAILRRHDSEDTIEDIIISVLQPAMADRVELQVMPVKRLRNPEFLASPSKAAAHRVNWFSVLDRQ